MKIQNGNKALLSVSMIILFAWGCAKESDPDTIYGNGRIEGNEVRVAAKIPGRIVRLHVGEGDRVKKDQPLVELSGEELTAQLERARAAVKAAQAGLVQSEAQLATLKHHEETAEVDNKRMKALHQSGAISDQRLDQSENALKEIQGRRKTEAARMAQLQAEVEAAKAAEAVAKTNLSESEIRSPLDGVVLLRVAEEGEVVQPGSPILVLVDPNDLFLKVYIAENEIGKVRLGNPAGVKIDAFPDRNFEGTVSEIAQQAEFTPKDIHMPDERTQLVFGVKISLENSEAFLKPGMPADAEIRWRTVGSQE
jgi:HlyD family secretion protein